MSEQRAYSVEGNYTFDEDAAKEASADLDEPITTWVIINEAAYKTNTELTTWLADAHRKNSELTFEVERLRRQLEKRRTERED